MIDLFISFLLGVMFTRGWDVVRDRIRRRTEEPPTGPPYPFL